jgi:hypothetical protein
MPAQPTRKLTPNASREVSVANGGLPVAVTFDVFCSWLDQGSGVLDWEIRRKDAWYFLNQKQNVENQAAERAAIGRTISLRELLAFVWNNPGIKGRSVWGAYGLKALVGLTSEALSVMDAHVAEHPKGPLLSLEELELRTRAEPIAYLPLRDDDENLLGIWSPSAGFAEGVIGEREVESFVVLDSFEASLGEAA